MGLQSAHHVFVFADKKLPISCRYFEQSVLLKQLQSMKNFFFVRLIWEFTHTILSNAQLTNTVRWSTLHYANKWVLLICHQVTIFNQYRNTHFSVGLPPTPLSLSSRCFWFSFNDSTSLSLGCAPVYLFRVLFHWIHFQSTDSFAIVSIPVVIFFRLFFI